MPSVVVTMIGARQFGSTWPNRIPDRAAQRTARLDVLLS